MKYVWQPKRVFLVLVTVFFLKEKLEREKIRRKSGKEMTEHKQKLVDFVLDKTANCRIQSKSCILVRHLCICFKYLH